MGQYPEVRLFGQVAVLDGERELGPRDFGGIKPKRVLEILLVARGRRVPKDRLAELLWADDLPRNISGALATYVSVLRRSLGPEGSPVRELIVTEPGAYRAGLEGVGVDLDRFDALLKEAETLSAASARQRLEQALALVRGELLEDEPYATWAEDLRGTYRARILGARLDAADAALFERDYAAGLQHAEEAVSLDRFSERAHRLTMLGLYAIGRQRDALEAFQRLRRTLDEELGLEPLAETKALQGSILRQDDVQGLLPRPDRVSEQVRVDPAPIAFLGRSAELHALTAGVRCSLAGSCSLVLVEGESGIGKSRLLDRFVSSLDGVRVGRATCSELERHLPYVPLATAVRDALRDVEPDLAALPALRQILPELRLTAANSDFPEVDSLESLVELVQAHAPIVLVLDDLQWADPSTFSALAYMQRRLVALPVALVAAARTDDIGADHPLWRLTPSRRFRLNALTASDVAPLGVPDLHERTGGDPRLVSAVARTSAADTLEQTLAETMLARCRAEGARAYRLLLHASALEQPFRAEALAPMLLADPARTTEELERLCDRGLLLVDGSRFRFRFDIYRDVLLSSLPVARRLRLKQLAVGCQRDWLPVSEGRPNGIAVGGLAERSAG
jgi:DNA-binding SARP family transcriptional activator